MPVTQSNGLLVMSNGLKILSMHVISRAKSIGIVLCGGNHLV
jgi:hypothetical protein